MAKPKPVRLPSDDCTVTIDGQEYTPHEGEWIEIYRGMQIGDLATLRKLAELQPKLEALEGEDGGFAEQVALLNDALEPAIPAIAERVVAWSWTDDRGRPYPLPADDPSALRTLRVDELLYLVKAIRSGTPDEAKNA